MEWGGGSGGSDLDGIKTTVKKLKKLCMMFSDNSNDIHRDSMRVPTTNTFCINLYFNSLKPNASAHPK